MMTRMMGLGVTIASLLLAGVVTASAQSANCRSAGGFPQWLETFKREAMADGISAATLASVQSGLVFDQSIINRDRGQRFFGQDFVTFSGKMLMPYRLQRGAQLIQTHAALFSRIERQYGVPAPVIVAFWGLESDFGATMGKLPILRSLATLAYDCRRPEMFRGELLAALRIIQRGDLSPSEMIGSWAGELGQTQFLPAHYYKYGVDFDGNGKRDLIRSVPDVLASTANYLMDLGWKRGEPWLEEVRVPTNLPWDQADLSIQHSRGQWARWGVTRADGRPLATDNLKASLLLPMGRFGPAFLAYDNFKIYTIWNNSLVYATTAAYYAARLAGAPAMNRGTGTVPSLSHQDMLELQRQLARQGFDVGKIDGILGAQTRTAVKAMQGKFGLPADSWPTAELLARMRGRS